MELGVGEALVSFLDTNGVPEMVQRTAVICPQSFMGSVEESVRKESLAKDGMSKYDEYVDNISAYEKLQNQAELEEKQARLEEERAQLEKEKAEFEKQKAKEEAAALKKQEKEREAQQRKKEKQQEAEQKKKEKAAERRKAQIERTLISTGTQVLKRGLFKTLFK